MSETENIDVKSEETGGLVGTEVVDRSGEVTIEVPTESNPEQLEEFFHTAGVIERVTILFDRYSGLPKGYAYVEFEHAEGVQRAIDDLHGKTFRGRELRVTPKRTNLPGFGKRGGRGRGRGRDQRKAQASCR